MNILKDFYQHSKCSYLENREQTMQYKVIDSCSSTEVQELIERGYRRFGKMYFRPECVSCNECKSIKIDVANYNFSKSERRVLKKSKTLNIYIQKPSLSKQHLSLFKEYHLYMQKKKGWEYSSTSAEHYYNSFVDGHGDYGYEILYFHEEKLIGVDLIDILQDGISSIYFYYHPDYAHLSLGKLSLLYQIAQAQEKKKKWIYLGYYVKDCSSLSYKADYKPYLTLEGNPSLEELYSWS